MSIGTSVFYNAPMEWMFATGASLTGGAVKLALLGSGYTPDAEADVEWADISGFEISHASYPAGGIALANPAVVRSGAAGKLDSDAWSLAVAAPDTAAKWAVVYVDATVGALIKPLLAYLDLNEGGGALTIPGGYTFTLDVPAVGWINWGAS